MCIAVVAIKASPKYPFVMIHNRDEYYERESLPFAEHIPGVFSGIDKKSNGMWLGVTKNGRFSFLTNYRDPKAHSADKISRGEIVKNFVTGTDSPEDYFATIVSRIEQFNPFNLILGSIPEGLFHFNSVHPKLTPLPNGIYGISNATLNTPWPKLEKAKRLVTESLRSSIETSEELIAKLKPVLSDTEQAPEHLLPETGVPLEIEKLVSSIFIRSAKYGTVASTIAVLTDSGVLSVREERYGRDSALPSVSEVISLGQL